MIVANLIAPLNKQRLALRRFGVLFIPILGHMNDQAFSFAFYFVLNFTCLVCHQKQSIAVMLCE